MKNVGLGLVSLILTVFFMPANHTVWMAGFLSASIIFGLMLRTDSAFFNKRLDEEHRAKVKLQRALFKLLKRR